MAKQFIKIFYPLGVVASPRMPSYVGLRYVQALAGIGFPGSDRSVPFDRHVNQLSLEAFFPFDPYLLRHSHRFVEPIYLHWQDVSPDTDVLSDSSDSDRDL